MKLPGWIEAFFSKPQAIPVNDESTSLKEILRQMNEPRPLPMGMKEFDEWAERILSGAMVPSTDKESLKAVLASMLLALGQTEDHKPDAYFIHLLRKAATNEVAAHVMRTKKEQIKQAQATAQITPINAG